MSDIRSICFFTVTAIPTCIWR